LKLSFLFRIFIFQLFHNTAHTTWLKIGDALDGWNLQFVMTSHLAQIQEAPQQDIESKGGSTAIQIFNLRHLGTGIIADVRARAPWYRSDWADAWNYRVVPATALTFFSK
jgi:hypothetical protein